MYFPKTFNKYSKTLMLTCWLMLLSLPILAVQNNNPPTSRTQNSRIANEKPSDTTRSSNLNVPNDLKIIIYQTLTAYEIEKQGISVAPKLTVINNTITWNNGEQKINLTAEEMNRIFTLAADAEPLPPDITSEVRFRCCGSPPHITLFFNKTLRETKKEPQLQQLIETLAQEKGYVTEASSGLLRSRQEMMRKLNPTVVEIDRNKINQTLSAGITLNPCQKNNQTFNSPDGKIKVVVTKGEGRVGTIYFDANTQTLTIKAICNNETQIGWNLELGYLFIREFIDRKSPTNTQTTPLNFNTQISAYEINSYTLITQIREK